MPISIVPADHQTDGSNSKLHIHCATIQWPVIQESLVNHYHVLTNEQLNEAVVITRNSPGPVGL